MSMSLTISGLTELPLAARMLIDFAGDERILLFEGPMGAGKTTFIKAICKELGVVDSVNSPTFSLVNEYLTSSGETIYHFDFYRIKDESEAWDIGADEYLESGNLCLIEWPSLVPNILPDAHISINLYIEGQEDRALKFTRHD